MPLTPKGKKIYSSMEKEYGEKKGKEVFYASQNKGTIKGVEGKKHELAGKMKHRAMKSVKNMESVRKPGSKTHDIMGRMEEHEK